MALVPSSTNATLPSLWGKNTKKNKNDNKSLMARTRLLTLAHDEMETVKILPDNYSVSALLWLSSSTYTPSPPLGSRSSS